MRSRNCASEIDEKMKVRMDGFDDNFGKKKGEQVEKKHLGLENIKNNSKKTLRDTSEKSKDLKDQLCVTHG